MDGYEWQHFSLETIFSAMNFSLFCMFNYITPLFFWLVLLTLLKLCFSSYFHIDIFIIPGVWTQPHSTILWLKFYGQLTPLSNYKLQLHVIFALILLFVYATTSTIFILNFYIELLEIILGVWLPQFQFLLLGIYTLFSNISGISSWCCSCTLHFQSLGHAF